MHLYLFFLFSFSFLVWGRVGMDVFTEFLVFDGVNVLFVVCLFQLLFGLIHESDYMLII